ncbi:MAG: hypothetical protein H5T76_36695, partial [Streptomyces sp.]|nr:hypothetical protein [Streptomyces sp.]
MSDGFCYWYRAVPGQVGAERILEVLEANGVPLANPVTGAITAVSNGPATWGEQIPVERAELLAMLSLETAQEFNF